jgi:hypothetical protein
LLAALDTEVRAQASRYWRLEPEAAASVLTIDLRELNVLVTPDNREIAFVTVVKLRMQRPGDAARVIPERTYRHISLFSDPAVWSGNLNGVLDTLMATTSREIGAEIVADLAIHH